MKVTFWGGPKDGEELEVNPGLRHLVVPLYEEQVLQAYDADDPAMLAVAPKTVACEIRLHSNGKRYAVWPRSKR